MGKIQLLNKFERIGLDYCRTDLIFDCQFSIYTNNSLSQMLSDETNLGSIILEGKNLEINEFENSGLNLYQPSSNTVFKKFETCKEYIFYLSKQFKNGDLPAYLLSKLFLKSYNDIEINDLKFEREENPNLSYYLILGHLINVNPEKKINLTIENYVELINLVLNNLVDERNHLNNSLEFKLNF